MANITSEHIHHMARRHHATMQQLDTLRTKISGYAQKGAGLIGTGAGAFVGGLLEGRIDSKIPHSLLAGVGFLVASHMKWGGAKYSEHLENVGNGFIAAYTSAIGYALGKRRRETGNWIGSGGNPWLNPYENGWPKRPLVAPTAAGQWPTPSPEQMAQIALQMQAAQMQSAANAPAY